MSTRLRVAVVGGGIGRQHIQAYSSLPEQFEVLGMCDTNRALAQTLADEYQIPFVFGALEDVLALEAVDVVDLCTPSHLHARQALEVLASGKHAIVEKPVAGSLAELDGLAQAETASGRRLMPIYQYRFGHGLQKLKLLVEAGLTGRAFLSSVETHWRRRAEYYAVPWRGKWQTELGGPLVTLAIHAHDALTYILGPVSRAFARTATRVNPIETEDCLSASLEMADGSLASLSVTTGSALQISRHRFCFERLSAESNTKPYQNTRDPWIFSGDTPELQAEIEAALEKFTPGPELYAAQFSLFERALAAGSELPVTLADARRSLELISALYYSAATDTEVELPLGMDHPMYAGWQPGNPVTSKLPAHTFLYPLHPDRGHAG